jgi:hypothetical protein
MLPAASFPKADVESVVTVWNAGAPTEGHSVLYGAPKELGPRSLCSSGAGQHASCRQAQAGGVQEADD